MRANLFLQQTTNAVNLQTWNMAKLLYLEQKLPKEQVNRNIFLY